MARPQKQTVDFFPHYCKHGKTIYILEQNYGNNGYTFWFKLLEELGSHNGHFLDLNDESELEFLAAKTRVSAPETLAMLNLLSRLGGIDKKLWEKRIVWSDNFVSNLSEVYAKRVVSAPKKPVSDTEIPVSGIGNPQSRVEYSKVDTIVPNGTSIIINGTTYMTEELTYEPLEGKQTKSKYGRATMAILARKYAELAGIELGKCFDASEWSKPLGSMYRYFGKDADKTIAYMEKAIKYFESKNLTYTPHTLSKDKEMMDKWTQGVEEKLDISERRKL